ncbi:MAG: nucleoside-diphosphate sugar epimerase/dehydratase [Clostridia bacterium]
MPQRKPLIILYDLACATLICLFVPFLFPTISHTASVSYMSMPMHIIAILLSITICRLLFHTYVRIWRYASSTDYLNLLLSDFCAGLCYLFFDHFLMPTHFSFMLILSIFSLIALTAMGSRMLYLVLHDFKRFAKNPASSQNKINIAIVGAGNMGTMLAKELLNNPNSHYQPYCFVDIDPHKAKNQIYGIKVLLGDVDVVEEIKKMPIQEIVIALPKLSADAKQKIYNIYCETGCKVKIYDYALGETSETGNRKLREINIEDLLFRESKSISLERVMPMYRDKTILVTGGGGSIGSELCRQLAKLSPKTLVIFDCYENNAYAIQQELHRRYGTKLNIIIEIGSVRDRQRLDELFAAHHPQVVFHAAAHKHVPLMEDSCGEAIKNNVLGTLNTVNAAEKYGVERFLLISTDKAVNPTSIMGASKRICEMIVQSRSSSKTKFVAVRFGNVLGSNGSVIPLFKEQIRTGGPITITDKRIIRYFMTIPEASQLLLETCAMAKAGEIYVLDMGMPVKILDLAENIIRLSGLVPYQDIDIQEVGLRPGEKLYEELLIKTEALDKTENDMIFIERDEALTRAEMDAKIALLTESLQHGHQAIVDAFHKTVPTFHAAAEVNKLAEQASEMRMVNHAMVG